MKTLRLYLDTSVIGGYFDAEFSTVTRRLFEELAAGRSIGVISDMVVRELLGAPPRVRDLIADDGRVPWEFVRESAEAVVLARAYLNAGVVGPRFVADCLHVAVATVVRVDLLVSWNFRHMVRYDRIRQFNGVNLALGYGMIDIRSPPEVVHYED